jgi:hypothetical protein
MAMAPMETVVGETVFDTVFEFDAVFNNVSDTAFNVR